MSARKLRVSLRWILCAGAMLVLAGAGCGGNKRAMNPTTVRSGGFQAAEEMGSLEAAPPTITSQQSLDEALADLNALPTPEGVDDALFAQLKDALGDALICRVRSRAAPTGNNAKTVDGGAQDPTLQGKIASTPPTGESNRVNDLELIDNGDGTFTLSWHYRNLGDYDQNGTVGIEDITPIAQHYGEEVPLDDDNCIQAVVDGSFNVKVEIADITPIAMHYAVECEDYELQGAYSLAGPFELVASIPRANAAGDGRLFFDEQFDDAGYDYYRVVPRDASGAYGEPSNVVLKQGGEPPEPAWALPYGDAQNTGRSRFRGPGVVVEETIYTGDAGYRMYLHAIGGDGTAYMTVRNENDGEAPSSLIAVTRDGEEVFLFEPGPREVTMVCLDEDANVYVGFGSTLYCLSSDGSVKWSFDTDQEEMSDPMLADDRVYIHAQDEASFHNPSPDGYLFAFSLDGLKLWERETPTSSSVQRPPAISSEGDIYLAVGDSTASVIAFSAQGDERWTAYVGGYKRSRLVVSDDGTAYVPTGEGIGAVSPSGEVVWMAEIGDVYGLLLQPNGTIVVYDSKGDLRGLSPSGDVEWMRRSAEYQGLFCTDAYGVSYAYGMIDLKQGSEGRSYHVFALSPDGRVLLEMESAWPALLAEDGVLYATRWDYDTRQSTLVRLSGPAGLSPRIVSILPGGGLVGEEFTPHADVRGDEPLSYEWSFEPPLEPTSSTDSSPTVSLTAAGNFAGSLILSNAVGSHTREFRVIVTDHPWGQYRHDPQHTSSSPFAGPEVPEVKWTYDPGGSDRITFEPAVARDGTIYVFAQNSGWGQLTALSDSGDVKWTVDQVGDAGKSLTIDEAGNVILWGDDQRLEAIDPEGEVAWQGSAGIHPYRQLLLAPSGILYYIYLRAEDGGVGSLTSEGALRWELSLGDVSPDAAVMTLEGNVLACFSGNPDLNYRVFSPAGEVMDEGDDLFLDSGPPVFGLAGEMLRNGTTVLPGMKYGFSGPETGHCISGIVPSSEARGAIDRGGVCYVMAEGALWAVSIDSEVKWTLGLGGDWAKQPVIGPGKRIYVVVGSYDYTRLYAIGEAEE